MATINNITYIYVIDTDDYNQNYSYNPDTPYEIYYFKLPIRAVNLN